MKTTKVLRDCRLRGDGVHHAMRGIARLYTLAVTGRIADHQSTRS
jgi:hypothetical protein